MGSVRSRLNSRLSIPTARDCMISSADPELQQMSPTVPDLPPKLRRDERKFNNVGLIEAPFAMAHHRNARDRLRLFGVTLRPRVSSAVEIHNTDIPGNESSFFWTPSEAELASFHGPGPDRRDLPDQLLQLSIEDNRGVTVRNLADDLSPEFVLYWRNYWRGYSTLRHDSEVHSSTPSLSPTTAFRTGPPSTPTTTFPITSSSTTQISGSAKASKPQVAVTNTISQASTDPSSRGSSRQFTKGELAGIGAGGAIGGLLFLGLLGDCLYRHLFKKIFRRRRDGNHYPNDDDDVQNIHDTTIPELPKEEAPTPELGSETKKPILHTANELDSSDSSRLNCKELDSSSPKARELEFDAAALPSPHAVELDASNSNKYSALVEGERSKAEPLFVSPASSTSARAATSSGQHHFPCTPPMDLEHGYGFDGTPGCSYQWFQNERQGTAG
ncbi:hypothetical protein V8F20_010914 [Naviculisporaceae sp. PSN 640]